MKRGAQQGLGVVAFRWLGGVRPRRKEGKWGEGPSLAINAMLFFRICLCISAFCLDKEGRKRTGDL